MEYHNAISKTDMPGTTICALPLKNCRSCIPTRKIYTQVLDPLQSIYEKIIEKGKK